MADIAIIRLDMFSVLNTKPNFQHRKWDSSLLFNISVLPEFSVKRLLSAGVIDSQSVRTTEGGIRAICGQQNDQSSYKAREEKDDFGNGMTFLDAYPPDIPGNTKNISWLSFETDSQMLAVEQEEAIPLDPADSAPILQKRTLLLYRQSYPSLFPTIRWKQIRMVQLVH